MNINWNKLKDLLGKEEYKKLIFCKDWLKANPRTKLSQIPNMQLEYLVELFDKENDETSFAKEIILMLTIECFNNYTKRVNANSESAILNINDTDGIYEASNQLRAYLGCESLRRKNIIELKDDMPLFAFNPSYPNMMNVRFTEVLG